MVKHHLYEDVATPIVIAHQGASHEAPRNTFPAFDLAEAVGADVLETDIHWTKDGVAVISHDSTVDAASNGHGFIRQMTLRELKKLDFGFRFNVNGENSYPFRNKGIKIPTLEETLSRYSGIRINIDVKPKFETKIRELVQQIDSCGALARVGLASFHHRVLQQIRRICPEVSTSASPHEVACLLLDAHLPVHRRQWFFDTLQVPEWQYGMKVVTSRFIARARNARIPVHVWTIDDVHEMRRLVHMGVSGIVTNRPREAVHALRNID